MTDDELLQVIKDELLQGIKKTARSGATSLDLSRKRLSSLPESIGQLTQLTSLRLRLRGNQLIRLPESLAQLCEALGQLTQLTSLDLSGDHIGSNQLTSLPESLARLCEALGQLTQLTSLDLSSNRLTSLPESIGQLTQLTSVDLRGNQLTSLPESIGQLTQLTSVDLRGNQLTSLPESLAQICEAVGQLTQLTTLNLSSNQLTSLPESLARLCEALGQLTQLTSLDLSSNQLTSLPEVIGQLTQLTTLDLGKNQLTSLPESIGQLTQLTTLALGENQLTSLPEEIGQLTQLTSLELSNNRLTNLPESIGQLTQLTMLDLKYNELTSPPEALVQLCEALGQLTQLTTLDLSHNQLTSLPEEIGQLTQLTTLDLRGNQLTGLPESIGQLTQLTSLDLHNNQLTGLPESIGQLTQLTTLYLSHNHLTSLPESLAQLCEALGQLTQLTTLYLSHNHLTSLPEEIGQLTQLTTLDLSGNQLTSLPLEIGRLTKLSRLDLHNNPNLQLPPEIRDKSVQEIVQFYRQRLEQSTDLLYEAKLLIIGEPGAGKTTLAKKILDEKYELQPDEESTDGIEIMQYRFPLANGKEFRVNIWDFGGQQIYHETHQFFLTKRSLYALVADARKEDTDFYYWLKVVELLSDNSPLLIVKNEKQNIQLAINERQLRGEFTNLKETLATNFADNRGLPELCAQIKHYISTLPHVGTELPKTWVAVREALEQKPDNYISLEAFLQLCQDNGFTRHADKLQLSGYLHDLGVCLHFQEDDVLCKTVILKPTWGTDAVYKVLRNPQVTNNLGKFTKQDLATIWRDEQYATMRPELLRLMMNFKLCYEIPTRPGNYIAPQLLSPEQPDYAWDETNNLLLRYEYEFMPKGILTRFIVEMHRWIEQQTCVWKTGVVLHKDGARAEVTELYRYHKGEIRIRVSGKRPRDLLTTIRHELDKIHASYERLRYSTLVPCNCQTCHGSQTPYFYELADLHEFMSNQQDQIQCRNKPFKMVSVRSLVDDVMPGSLPSDSQRQLSPARQRILQAEMDRRYEKLRQLRLSRASEAGAAIDFQLQQQIAAEEAEIAKLEAELNGLEVGDPHPEPGSTTTINIQTAYGVAGNVERDQTIHSAHKHHPDGDV